MNRKIMLLPLSALLMVGLTGCDLTAAFSGVDFYNNPETEHHTSEVVSEDGPLSEPESSEPIVEEFDGFISDIEPGTDALVAGVVAQVGTKGWTISDGKAAAYIYGALPAEFTIGDFVNVSAACTGYYGLYELKGATVTKRDDIENAPVLPEAIEMTAEIANGILPFLAGKASADATWAPTNSVPFKFTNVTTVDVAGYPGVALDGVTNNAKFASYYYNKAMNRTEANRGAELYVGCAYDLYFYITGTSAAGNLNMGLYDVVPHFVDVQSVTLDPTEATIDVEGTVTLTASVLPEGAPTGIAWASDNAEVATVKNGVVTGVSAGVAHITATSTFDGTKAASATITVNAAAEQIDTYSLSLADFDEEGNYTGSAFVLSNLDGKVDAGFNEIAFPKDVEASVTSAEGIKGIFALSIDVYGKYMNLEVYVGETQVAYASKTSSSDDHNGATAYVYGYEFNYVDQIVIKNPGAYKVDIYSLTMKAAPDHQPETPEEPPVVGPTDLSVVATFTCGENGDATHFDGSGATTYEEAVGEFTLKMENGVKFYKGARDATGNGCIKLGTGSAVGSFSITGLTGIAKVRIHVAGYKANNASISLNGAAAVLVSKHSNDGEYDTIEAAPVEGVVTFTTTDAGYRCMINTIEFLA